MKRIIFLLILFLFACKEEIIEPESNCVEIKQNPDWLSEPFKSEYLIQFPDNYGGGLFPFEGNTFGKGNYDGIEFYYFYCSGHLCYDFGRELEYPYPESIYAYDKFCEEDKLLNKRREFCEDGKMIGILYHNERDSAMGNYYMVRDSSFFEGVAIHFPINEYQEIEDILRTIKKN